MKKTTVLLVIVAMMGLLLAGCGGEATTNDDSGEAGVTSQPAGGDTTPTVEVIEDAESSSAEAGFTAQLSGAEEKSITGPGFYQCTEPTEAEIGDTTTTLPGYQEIAAEARAFDSVQFLLPRNIGPGEYTLNTMGTLRPGDDFVAIAITDPAVMYGNIISGTLTLEQLPAAAGDTVKGSFTFSASNGSEIINVEGAFEFTTSAATAFCEPVDQEGS